MMRSLSLRCPIELALVGALLACAAAGCAISRPSRSSEALAAHREEVVRQVIVGREQLSRKIIARAISEQDKGNSGYVIDFLILSGGGDYGAFGAGVLKGW